MHRAVGRYRLTLNLTRLSALREVYSAALTDAVNNHPDEYRYPLTDVPIVVNRMMAAIERNSFNKDGYAFKSTCKTLGIKHTYKGIYEYLQGADDTEPICSVCRRPGNHNHACE